MTKTENGQSLIRKSHLSPQLRWANKAQIQQQCQQCPCFKVSCIDIWIRNVKLYIYLITLPCSKTFNPFRYLKPVDNGLVIQYVSKILLFYWTKASPKSLHWSKVLTSSSIWNHKGLSQHYNEDCFKTLRKSNHGTLRHDWFINFQNMHMVPVIYPVYIQGQITPNA